VRARWKILGVAAFAVCLAIGIYLWRIYYYTPPVPLSNGGVCTVRLGALRNDVLAACGKACGRGDVPKGGCGSSYGGQEGSLIKLCSNQCEVYRDVAVCYAGTEVVEVERLPATGILAKPCSW